MKAAGLVAFAAFFLSGCSSDQLIVLDPKGPVGRTELHLIYLSVLLCAIVVIPVLAILVYILVRYRDKPGNKALYQPKWDDSKVLEVIWWGIPIVIIGILGVYTVKGVHTLTKPPVKNVNPITIQVTSLDWKWLFEYPDQGVATVNYVEIPAGVPVQFELTADGPMNSFWVPQLGGQEYTMPGMAMRLWLQADQPGTYFGSGANFTGEGFAHMRFNVIAKPQSEFNQWVKHVKDTAPAMTNDDYAKLKKQGLSHVKSYSSYPEARFRKVIDKNGGQYMNMDQNKNDMSNMDMKH
ncbi:cytochrome c oxidase subunit II [Falsibacillus albus]|uniref:Quinol oxidase subunit 2 n=1 Tax=Falsibacillus albus TaxID=2478915 RepID=A0A3L7JPT2_9BACI|nr:cytochrome c oxidase subunit II [Falsibacillus albus]